MHIVVVKALLNCYLPRKRADRIMQSESIQKLLHAEHSCDDNGILKGSWEIIEVYSFASALHIALHGPEDILIFPKQ